MEDFRINRVIEDKVVEKGVVSLEVEISTLKDEKTTTVHCSVHIIAGELKAIEPEGKEKLEPDQLYNLRKTLMSELKKVSV